MRTPFGIAFGSASGGLALPVQNAEGQAIQPPRLVSQVPADYTPRARAAGIEGDVHLQGVVNTEGRVEDIRLLQSLDPGLDQKAIEAVRQWRFTPGRRDGRPMAMGVAIRVIFRLPAPGER